MKCPKCSGNLKAVIANGIEIDQCDNCNGIWFDVGELDWLLDVPKLEVKDEVSNEHPVLDQQRGACPRCGGTGHMIRLWMPDSDIYVDACPTCSGRWLDGGELSELRNAKRAEQLRNFMKSAKK